MAASDMLDRAMGTVPTVVGLDLSLTATGIANDTGTHLVRSTGHADATLYDRHHRIATLTERIGNLVPPMTALAVIEAPSFGQQRQGGTHDRAGLWWLVVDWLHSAGHLVLEVPPATLKKYVTGKGNAKKPDVRMALYKRFGIDLADDNEADAYALRAIGLHLLGHPLTTMPALNLSALDKLTAARAVAS